MTTVIPSVVETRQQVATLLSEINQLTELLAAQSGLEAVAYQLPVMSYAHRCDEIDVRPLFGDEALQFCLSAYRQIYREDDQDPVTSARYPGIIFCSDLMIERVTRINALKDQLAATLSSLKGRPRATFMRQALPNVSTHHLCRHIPFVLMGADDHFLSVGFTWAGNTAITRRMNYEQAISFCARRSPTGAIHPNDLEVINASSGNLYERRLMAPHPRINLTTYLSTMQPTSTVMRAANLPLLIATPRDQVIVSPLFSYQDETWRQSRSDKKPLRPLLPHIDLYEEIAS